jgi:hypothetical protein
MKQKGVQQCGICERWTDEGTNLPSGLQDGKGRTPSDNFVCDRCRAEIHAVRQVKRQSGKFLRARMLSEAA